MPGAWRSFSFLVVDISRRHRHGIVVDHLEDLLAGEVGEDIHPFDCPAPGVIDAVRIGAIAKADTAACLLGKDHPCDGDRLTTHTRKIGDPVALERRDHAGVLLDHVIHGVEL